MFTFAKEVYMCIYIDINALYIHTYIYNFITKEKFAPILHTICLTKE